MGVSKSVANSWSLMCEKYKFPFSMIDSGELDKKEAETKTREFIVNLKADGSIDARRVLIMLKQMCGHNDELKSDFADVPMSDTSIGMEGDGSDDEVEEKDNIVEVKNNEVEMKDAGDA